MANESTKMHGPGDQAPEVSEIVAYCTVCHCEWQVRGDTDLDQLGCAFCDAPAAALRFISEGPDSSGQVVV